MSTIYPDANCNLVNDRTDIYGLGIRIGVYLQWFALVLVYSSNLGTSERDIIRDVTYVFSGALLISLGLRNDAIWASDGFIVVCLLGSTVGLLLVLEAIDRSVACIYRKFDSVVEALRRVFLLTVSLYLVWWWFRGIDQSGTGSNCIPGYTVYLCGQRVHLQRGFRLCGRIISTIMFVIVLAASVHFLMRRHVWRYHHDEDHPSGIREGWTVTGQFRTMLGNRYVYLVGKPPPDPPRGYFGTSRRDEVWDANGTRKAKHAVFGAWFLGLVILMVILFVEMVINFQGVDGVSSVSGSGQLIPLIIGCASMVLVIYHIACREYPRDQPRNPPPAGGSYAPPANGDNPPPTGGDYPSEPVANPPPTGGDYPSDPVANPPPAVGGYPTPAEGSYAPGTAETLPQPVRLIDVNTGEVVAPPPNNQHGYSILSHTWCEKEIILSDILAVGGVFNLGASNAGDKIKGAVQAAKSQGTRYLWMDTCCINKTNKAEESVSIRSMANWYANAQVCLVYLDDTEPCTFEDIVALKKSMSLELYRDIHALQEEIDGLNSRLDSVLQSNRGGDRELESMGGMRADLTQFDTQGLENYQRLTDLKYANERTILKLTNAIEEKEKALLKEREKAREKDRRERRSVVPRWCTRGWTLQEVVMCCKAVFYNTRWEHIGTYGGGNLSKQDVVADLCSVPGPAICQGKAIAGALGGSTVLALMSARNTTIEHDLIYSVMGMLGIDLMVDYGEKFEDTVARAIDEIVGKSRDISVFNWTGRHLGSSIPGRSLYPVNVKGYENEYANLGPLISESKITLTYPGVIASFELQRVCIMINRTITPSLEAVEKYGDTATIDPESDLFTCQIINERGIQAKTRFICSTLMLKNELRFLDSLPFEVNKEPFQGIHDGAPGMAPEAQRFLREQNVEMFCGQWVLAKFAECRGAKWFLCMLEKDQGGEGYTGQRIATDEFKFEMGQTEEMLDTHRVKVPSCEVAMK